MWRIEELQVVEKGLLTPGPVLPGNTQRFVQQHAYLYLAFSEDTFIGSVLSKIEITLSLPHGVQQALTYLVFFITGHHMDKPWLRVAIGGCSKRQLKHRLEQSLGDGFRQKAAHRPPRGGDLPESCSQI